jgi:hypothetical protein
LGWYPGINSTSTDGFSIFNNQGVLTFVAEETVPDFPSYKNYADALSPYIKKIPTPYKHANVFQYYIYRDICPDSLANTYTVLLYYENDKYLADAFKDWSIPINGHFPNSRCFSLK